MVVIAGIGAVSGTTLAITGAAVVGGVAGGLAAGEFASDPWEAALIGGGVGFLVALAIIRANPNIDGPGGGGGGGAGYHQVGSGPGRT